VRNIKLTIEYDGTNYNGWQSQKNGNTVEDMVREAIYLLTGEKVDVIGSGRTDSGVHAYGQVANFYTQSSIPADKFSFALSSKLPCDIVIRESVEVGSDFHARFSAKGKKYRYLLYNSPHPSALLRNRTYHVFYNLNIEAMKEASCFFLGTHDFVGFMAKGSNVKTTVRTIKEINVRRQSPILTVDEQSPIFIEKQSTITAGGQSPITTSGLSHMQKENGLIQIEITGDGFLYNMVRIIVGTLIEVGIGKLKSGDIKNIIESCNRVNAGRTVPACGLYLVEVYY